MPCFVETTLCHSLQQGKFCYVAQPSDRSSSTEKFSLCQRTSAEMESRGYRSIVVQAQSIVTDNSNSQDNWAQRFIQSVWQSLYSTDLIQLSRWLEVTVHLSHRDRLLAFASELLLNEICAKPFIILIENVDVLRALPSAAGDVFAWIEHCYELRDTYLTYHHLSFAVFSSEIINQTVLSTSDFPSHFEGSIENSRYLDELNNSRSNSQTDTYPEKRFSSSSRNCLQSVIEKPSICCSTNRSPVLGQSQYARGTTEMQLPARRFYYDPPYYSYFAC